MAAHTSQHSDRNQLSAWLSDQWKLNILCSAALITEAGGLRIARKKVS
jgi:hypothetical protein